MVVCTVVSVALILFAETSVVYGGAGTIWGYQDGIPPAMWPLEYRTCGGRQQSPIDININSVRVNPRLSLFDFTDLNTINNVRLTMENNGHTVEVDVDDRNTLHIRGGGLPGPYIVKQWHYHWGSVDSRGSEHDINGRFFPMEMHVVTYSARFNSFEQAKNATGGLAVLSFLFDIGDDNPMFEEVVGSLGQVRHKDDHVDIQSFALTSLFPRNTDVFYRYYGGLTTPPCYESVIWTVFKEHIKISERQINQFRMLSERHIARFRPLSDNFRPTQPLNGRLVYTNDRRGLEYFRPVWPSTNLQSRRNFRVPGRNTLNKLPRGPVRGVLSSEHKLLRRIQNPRRVVFHNLFMPRFGQTMIHRLGNKIMDILPRNHEWIFDPLTNLAAITNRFYDYTHPKGAKMVGFTMTVAREATNIRFVHVKSGA